jgi:hypothetical protein
MSTRVKPPKRGSRDSSSLRPRLKMFRPVSWSDRASCQTTEYLSHLLLDLGRLGLTVHDIESHDRAPHTQCVLSDLLAWLEDHPSDAFAQLSDWKCLDLNQMADRVSKNREAKPRIEVSAVITRMNNLSVRWHPAGWRQAYLLYPSGAYDPRNFVPNYKWPNPPDFRWFAGDEDPTFDARPTNELMYIRGVANLSPDPRGYGPYVTYNVDVVHSVLICAVRAAYEQLIRQLQRSFEVDVLHAFDFTVRDEIDADNSFSQRFPTKRVVAWTLEEAQVVLDRHQRAAAAETERREREQLASIETEYGFSAQVLVDELAKSHSKAAGLSDHSDERVNRDTAKALRTAGFKVDAGQVRRLRYLIKRYQAEVLPEALRPPPAATAVPIPSPSATGKVLQFPGAKSET